MNKTDLVNHVANETRLTKKQSRAAINAMFSTIINGLKRDEEVVILGFCIFEVREWAESFAINPKTWQRIHVPARGVIKIIPGQKLLEATYAYGKQKPAQGHE
jgi:DNA-binding protein HU-beta